MTSTPTAPWIVLVNGLPGAGKTSVAAGLARTFARAAVLEGDRLQNEVVVSGAVDVGDDPLDEGWRQLDLRWANLAALTRNFHDAGFTVVVDSLVIPTLLAGFRAAVGDRPLAYVHLDPPTDVRRARDAARGARAVGDRYDGIATEFDPLRGHGAWIDSGPHTLAQTVDIAHDAVVTGRARLT